MKIYFHIIWILALFFGLPACTITKEEKITLNELETLDQIDRIEIFHRKDFNSPDYHLKTIENLDQINLIVKFFESQANGWEAFHPYAPPGLLYVEFYEQEKRNLGIMIGYTDNTSSGNTFFHLSQPYGLGKPLKEREFETLMNLLEVDKDLAYYNTRKSRQSVQN